MKVFGGNICGHKHQSTEFVQTGPAKGSYRMYVCTIKVQEGRAHKQRHYDNVHNVYF